MRAPHPSPLPRSSVFGALVLATTLFAFGCVGHLPPRMPYAAESAWGVVQAEDPAIARAVADIIDEIAPRIEPFVPGLDQRKLDVRVVRGFADPLWGGATFQMPAGYWMEIPVGSLPDLAASTIAHELVHYWLGADWQPLPAVVEEGLADLVAGEVLPDESTIERAGYAVLLSTALSGGLELRVDDDAGANPSRAWTLTLNADLDRATMPPLEDVLEMTSRELNAVADRENRLLLYGFGYLFASRIGVERLYDLCLQARERGLRRVPADWLYAAAGIDRHDPRSWRVAIEGMVGSAEREVLTQMQEVGDGMYRLARPGR